MQVYIGKDGGDNAPLWRPCYRVHHRSIRFQYPCFQPLLDQPYQRPVINALFQHLDQPFVVYVLEVALDVSFHYEVISSKLELDRQLVHRVQSPNVWAIAIATAHKILLVDGFQYPLDR